MEYFVAGIAFSNILLPDRLVLVTQQVSFVLQLCFCQCRAPVAQAYCHHCHRCTGIVAVLAPVLWAGLIQRFCGSGGWVFCHVIQGVPGYLILGSSTVYCELATVTFGKVTLLSPTWRSFPLPG
jgi:hypothetical protein